jgi:hypothetical protein
MQAQARERQTADMLQQVNDLMGYCCRARSSLLCSETLQVEW